MARVSLVEGLDVGGVLERDGAALTFHGRRELVAAG
jgi:hypothetical protein